MRCWRLVKLDMGHGYAEKMALLSLRRTNLQDRNSRPDNAKSSIDTAVLFVRAEGFATDSKPIRITQASQTEQIQLDRGREVTLRFRSADAGRYRTICGRCFFSAFGRQVV